MSDLKDKPVADRISAPAKRWKNMFKTNVAFEDIAGQRHMVGSVGRQPNTFPSKETAEQGAIDYERKHFCGKFAGTVTYLGAFPE